MRWFIAALLLATAVAEVPAQAQTPLTGTTGAPLSPGATVPPSSAAEQVAPPIKPAPAPRRARRTLDERFEEANTTHDGHLTLEQARAKMPAVARDFAAIDTDNKGYVTLDQIKAERRAKRAARRAAKEQK